MYEFFLNVLGFIELAAIIWLVAWFRRRGRERKLARAAALQLATWPGERMVASSSFRKNAADDGALLTTERLWIPRFVSAARLQARGRGAGHARAIFVNAGA